MPTKVKRASALNPSQTFTEHLTLKFEAGRLQKRADTLKGRLKDNFDSFKGIYANENGSKFFDLPTPIRVAGKWFKGMEMRRSAPTTFDEEVAEKILRGKGVYAEALSNYVDQNKVILLQQQGKITEADIDAMFKSKESFAFWPVEAEDYEIGDDD